MAHLMNVEVHSVISDQGLSLLAIDLFLQLMNGTVRRNFDQESRVIALKIAPESKIHNEVVMVEGRDGEQRGKGNRDLTAPNKYQ